MFDYFFQGGIDERFTDWDTAREFVIFQTIVNNPRMSDKTKIALQDIEQKAYDANANQFTQTEKTEIARYYTYLRNQFPSATDDERFLNIFEAASEVQADQSSINTDDFKVPNDVKIGAVTVGVLVGLVLLLTRD